ncbi:Protein MICRORCHIDIA 6 [Camellia lanceoleosa]|uniref:Protein MICRORCHIDIA 6 n=1 Tax=Camellia lanceoleosa TaxID=1840588 RepID=A0ACC0FLA3_9ERIC|nr:Protein MICRORCHIDIA 6 [Camellia lanceoleosa]
MGAVTQEAIDQFKSLMDQVDYEVNICTGKLETLNHCGKEHFMSNLSMLLQWSPYSTEAELLQQLQPNKVKRQMTIFNGKLFVHFEVVKARFLRASFSAFMDVLMLATKTIEEFGQGMEL